MSPRRLEESNRHKRSLVWQLLAAVGLFIVGFVAKAITQRVPLGEALAILLVYIGIVCLPGLVVHVIDRYRDHR